MSAYIPMLHGNGSSDASTDTKTVSPNSYIDWVVLMTGTARHSPWIPYVSSLRRWKCD